MGELKGKVIWQDVNGLVSDGNIAYNSSTGAITISSTSSATGNAVVGLQANGTTVWSWHIWKPSITPTAWNSWLNLNLGAVDQTGTGSMGFLYQWGRKDPFPTSATFTHMGASKVSYDGTGVVVHGATTQGSPSEATTEVNNLANSIRNPFVFYTGASAAFYDWYTSTIGEGGALPIISELSHIYYGTQNIYLWNGKAHGKTPFDPCPNGYRVPAAGNNTLETPWAELQQYLTRYSAGSNAACDQTENMIIPMAGWRGSNGVLGDAGRSAMLLSKFSSGASVTWLPQMLRITYWNPNPNRPLEYELVKYTEFYNSNNMNDLKASARSVRCQQGD